MSDEVKGKIFVIGDIHGCIGMLKRLLDRIPFNPSTDRLIFLGDYIDRGEDPKGVIDFLIDLAKKTPRIDFLMGNHESLFLNYIEGREEKSYLYNGGDFTLNSYMKNDELNIPEDHLKFFKSLKMMVELDNYYIVHAGFRPGIPVKDQSINDMLWIRHDFIDSGYDFGKKVIFGHTSFDEPLVKDNKIGLDTGAVFGNKLTCLELPGMIFHSIEA